VSDRRVPGSGTGIAAALAEAWPLVRKNLRRFWLRDLLLAALMGVTLAGYVLFSFYMGTGGVARRPVFPASGLNDVYVAMFSSPRPVGQLRQDLSKTTAAAAISALGYGTYRQVYTSVGELPFLGLPADSPVWGKLGVQPPPPGSVLVPEDIAARAGLSAGASLALVDATSGRSRPLLVAGTFAAPLGIVDAMLIQTDNSTTAGNVIFAVTASGPAAPGPAVVRTWLESLDPQILQGPDFLGTMWDRLRAQVTAPGSTVVATIFLFAVLGIMSVLFLSFLDRRPELAILKTIGADATQITAMFVLEISAAAGMGAALGLVFVAAGRAGLAWLGMPLAGTGLGGLIAAFVRGFLGLAVLTAVGAALPVALARAATVTELLNDAGVYLIRRRVGAWRRPV